MRLYTLYLISVDN